MDAHESSEQWGTLSHVTGWHMPLPYREGTACKFLEISIIMITIHEFMCHTNICTCHYSVMQLWPPPSPRRNRQKQIGCKNMHGEQLNWPNVYESNRTWVDSNARQVGQRAVQVRVTKRERAWMWEWNRAVELECEKWQWINEWCKRAVTRDKTRLRLRKISER